MRQPVDLVGTDGLHISGVEWVNDDLNGSADGGAASGIPLLLVSDEEHLDEWQEFAEFAAGQGRWGRVVALTDPPAFQILEAIWSIGQPAVLCANGSVSGDAALEALYLARGSLPLLALIDFKVDDSLQHSDMGAGRVAVIRGRQSQRATHEEAVAARDLIGERCELIELEDTGDNAAMSNPAGFESAIHWLAYGS